MLKYKNYTLIKPNKIQEEQILHLIADNGGFVFQEVQLNKIIEEEFKSELFYLVDDPNNISNFSPVHIEKKKFGLKRYHFKPLYDIPYGGFLKDGSIDYNKLSAGLFDSINYIGLPVIDTADWNKTISRKGETCVIDLYLEEDDIFNNSIHSKRRNMIRKALKSEITVKSYFSKEGLNYFWPMLSELHDKLGYAHLKRSLYEKILESYGHKNQAYILVAFKNDKPISGVFILGNKNNMMYYKGASSYGFKNEGQGELLQWEAIKISKSLNVNYYDLGNLQKEQLPAIYRFKTGISNRIVNYPIHLDAGYGYKLVQKISK